MDRIQDIINFWFRGVNDKTPIERSREPFCLWFKSTPQFDEEIRKRYEPDLIRAKQGELSVWEESMEGQLALILLYDQFSRNMYRGTPKAYETDARALAVTRRLIDEQTDLEFQRIARVFVYMPLMHAEDRSVQELSVRKFTALVEEASDFASPTVPYYQWHLKYATDHRNTINTHGRFPSRDKILNRTV